MIKTLSKNQVIVVGTNMLGKHCGGAARQALIDFGLKAGIAEGKSGKTYAFPTLNENFEQKTINQLIKSRIKLYQECEKNPDKEYLLTPVGTGIAGFEVSFMKSLFINPPKNLILPNEFKN